MIAVNVEGKTSVRKGVLPMTTYEKIYLSLIATDVTIDLIRLAIDLVNLFK